MFSHSQSTPAVSLAAKKKGGNLINLHDWKTGIVSILLMHSSSFLFSCGDSNEEHTDAVRYNTSLRSLRSANHAARLPFAANKNFEFQRKLNGTMQLAVRIHLYFLVFVS